MNGLNILLKEYEEKYNVIEKAKQAFWNMYDFFLIECEETGNQLKLSNHDSIEIKADVLSYESSNENKYSVEIQMYRIEDDKCLGDYVVYFDDYGEIKDDFLVLASDPGEE